MPEFCAVGSRTGAAARPAADSDSPPAVRQESSSSERVDRSLTLYSPRPSFASPPGSQVWGRDSLRNRFTRACSSAPCLPGEPSRIAERSSDPPAPSFPRRRLSFSSACAGSPRTIRRRSRSRMRDPCERAFRAEDARIVAFFLAALCSRLRFRGRPREPRLVALDLCASPLAIGRRRRLYRRLFGPPTGSPREDQPATRRRSPSALRS